MKMKTVDELKFGFQYKKKNKTNLFLVEFQLIVERHNLTGWWLDDNWRRIGQIIFISIVRNRSRSVGGIEHWETTRAERSSYIKPIYKTVCIQAAAVGGAGAGCFCCSLLHAFQLFLFRSKRIMNERKKIK